MKTLCVDRDVEASHFITCGNSGSGKSRFIHQLISYARACGDSAIILDSKPEFIACHYRPELGDKILGPRDNRTVFWDLPNEVTDLVDSLSVMRALFPTQIDNPQAKFFDNHGCKIFADLLVRWRPSCAELGRWLCHPKEIDKRVKGTEHEQTLTENAAPQRAGILGTMNEIGLTLRLWPKSPEGREVFTLREWSEDPKGQILFLPNDGISREALRPAQTAMIDIGIRRVMSRRNQSNRTWIITDELDTLNRTMALLEGMTLMRDSGNPMVLGFQNFAQLVRRYGKEDARTIFSQAYTLLLLATTEPESRKMLEEFIGDAEYRRYQLSSGKGGVTVSGPHEFSRPIVKASEIGKLKNLNGYVLQRGEVVRIKLPYLKLPQLHPAKIERLIPPMEPEIVPEEEPEPLPPMPRESQPSPRRPKSRLPEIEMV
jgi:type IV secretory pathway TraG/TraD family ATPase VirD4